MICPLSPGGLECTEMGLNHHNHSTVVKDDSVAGSHPVYWDDPPPPQSPDGTRRSPGKDEMIDKIHEMEGEVERIPRQPDPMGDDIGKVGRDHPSTSKEAARNGLVRYQRVQLHELVKVSGERGMTCFEAAQRLGISPNQTATRMMELRERGLVWRDEGGSALATRTTTPGHRGHIHWATTRET